MNCSIFEQQYLVLPCFLHGAGYKLSFSRCRDLYGHLWRLLYLYSLCFLWGITPSDGCIGVLRLVLRVVYVIVAKL